MSWTWRLESADGTPMSSPSVPAQPTQADAESWLGETWRSLAEAGVAQASLLCDGTLKYGPMKLAE